jgi:flagellar protein FliS
MNPDARSVYRQSVGQDASPVRLVVVLYEQLIEDLRRAAVAVEQGDVASRTNQLSHALEVLGELDASLNPEAGEEVARNLTHFYRLLRHGLFQVQVRPNRRVLEKYLASLLSLREAWIQVERVNAASPASGQAPASAQYRSAPPESAGGDWRG